MRKRLRFESDAATGPERPTPSVKPAAYEQRLPDNRCPLPPTALPSALADGIVWDEV
jgi:hypothetical protein